MSYTTSGTDLAISGDGFYIVESPDGIPVLTRAGDFTPDKERQSGERRRLYADGLSLHLWSAGRCRQRLRWSTFPINVNQSRSDGH